jgi:hypothetical protein
LYADHGCAIASIREASIAPSSFQLPPTTNAKTRDIHIHLPLHQGDLKSENIHIHLGLNGSEIHGTQVQKMPKNGDNITQARPNDGKALPNGKQTNGTHINGHAKPPNSPPSWSNGLPKTNGSTYTSGLLHVPAKVAAFDA